MNNTTSSTSPATNNQNTRKQTRTRISVGQKPTTKTTQTANLYKPNLPKRVEPRNGRPKKCSPRSTRARGCTMNQAQNHVAETQYRGTKQLGKRLTNTYGTRDMRSGPKHLHEKNWPLTQQKQYKWPSNGKESAPALPISGAHHASKRAHKCTNNCNTTNTDT